MPAGFKIGSKVRCKWGQEWFDAVVEQRFNGGKEYDVSFPVDNSIGRVKVQWLKAADGNVGTMKSQKKSAAKIEKVNSNTPATDRVRAAVSESTTKKPARVQKKSLSKTTDKKVKAGSSSSSTSSSLRSTDSAALSSNPFLAAAISEAKKRAASPGMSAYEKARARRIAQNQRELALLKAGMEKVRDSLQGSSEVEKKRKRAARQSKPRKRRTKVSPKKLRRSSRTRGSAPEYGKEKLDEFFNDGEYAMAKKAKGKSPRKRRMLSQEAAPLTAEQRAQLAKFDIDDFERFLLTVPHGRNCKPVSEANCRTVLRQVKLLVSGAGVHYHHWPEGFYFRKGEPVTLAMDIGEIQDAANEIDRRPGYRDLGNGWLLNHPLQKLMNYQFYLHHMAEQRKEVKE